MSLRIGLRLVAALCVVIAMLVGTGADAFALPAVLYAGLVQVIRKSTKGHEDELHEQEKETGLRAQL